MLGFLLSPVLQIEDIDGKPLVGGKVFVYEANTSNLATVYKDYNGTFNTNPVILDTAGHNTIIAEDDKLYDIIVKDANDNLLFSVEDVAVGGEGGSAIITDITVQAGNNGIAVGQSVVSGVKTFKVSADYNFLASQSDLANKQDKLSAGPNIDITSNVVSGKDWQNEIDAAVSAVSTGFIPYSATNIPAGSSVSVYGDNMLLVGKNITGYAYGNLVVGENIDKMAPNGLIAGSGINGFQNDILVGNGVSAGGGPNVVVVGDSISAALCSLIIGGPSVTGTYGESTIVVGNNNLTGMDDHNVVLGHANTATSGSDNVIIGRGNSTTGSGNIVIGIDNSSNSGTIFGGIYNQVDNFGYIFGGSYNSATNAAATLNGDGCYASGTGSVAQGQYTSALGDGSHSEGYKTTALRTGDHAEGEYTQASGEYSHAEGFSTLSIGYQSHAEGYETSSIGAQSHSEGDRTQSIGYQSHAEGLHTSAYGDASHAEGNTTSAVGYESHSEGLETKSIGQFSHSEGYATSASGYASHAEGDHTYSEGIESHAEGGYTSAIGNCSHAEGHDTIASGHYSHAGGHGTSAFGENQTVFGKYNNPNTGDIFQIGCGTFGSGVNAFVVSPSSDSISSDNHYDVDGNGNIISYPNTATSYINEPNVKVRTELQPVSISSMNPTPPNPEDYLYIEDLSINKNLSLPKFYIKNISPDDYNNTKFETYQTYYNLDEGEGPFEYNVNLYSPDFSLSASTVETNNTLHLFQHVPSYIDIPTNYYTIIPEHENGLYKIEFRLHIKGGYDIVNNNKVRDATIRPLFSGVDVSYTPQTFGGLYKGFPSGTNISTPINTYNFNYYISRYKNSNNTNRIALTGLDFYVPNKRWNVQESQSQQFYLTFTRIKLREYEGPTYVSNSAADVTVELD